MFVLLLFHLLIGVSILVSGDRFGRRAFAVAALAPAVTVVWAATQWSDVVGNGAAGDVAGSGVPVTQSVGWISQLGLNLDLRFDAFALVMTLLVSGIGLLVCVYAYGYFSHIAPGQARLAGLMTIFAASMLGVVWADHLIALFIAWELTSITSYLLIGNDDTNPRARAAALQAIFITGAGGLALLAGLIILGQSAGTYRISEMLESPPSGGAVSAGLILVLLGAFTKSAQAPFGSWLPGAMVAPTPVSAYLHSATMVKAGVYLVARLSPILAGLGQWRVLVLVVGSVTMIVGGLRALRQHDLKLLLAYGTVSQLGFMMLLLGTGEYKIAQAGVVLLLAHGAFKATLFMLVGIIDHEAGTRDIRELHGFGAGWMPVKVMAVIGAASMAGLPPLLGFVAKEKGIDTYLEYGEFTGATAVLVVIVVGSILTFAYSARYVLGVFGYFGSADEPVTSRTVHAPPLVFSGPAMVLTAATVVLGLLPMLISDLTKTATLALDPHASPSTVKLWAGFNTAFVLSLVIIATGAALTALRGPVANVQAKLAAPLRKMPSTDDGFEATVRSIDTVANRVTRYIQSGSLPVYLLVILATVVTVPVIPMLGELDSLPEFVERPIHVPLVAVILGAAIGATLIRRRMAAVVMLSAVGFAMAGLYEAQGAPDLALTQFAIETLGTVLFVLVLRFLPSRFVDLAPAVVRPVRLAVSVLVACAIFVFAIVSTQARSDVPQESVSVEMIERSKPDGEGKNVVNVILVDFRGVDTMGEITVLLVAAVGAFALARSGRGRDDDESVVAPAEEAVSS
ncbi:hydrogen gas-evolving membrane-bound hydrogenase subunit E [Ilumatobacter coccineus]|uniref:Na(+)/H(+) antiporter subunit A n=1 Tax=Ilumatobacter coccineus (strain NBRC 103263 / KCTC 29153 / YM16-304) TaxID=1313172 RepID=A0A6C7EGL9_ILUCY|nr:hydrogen gas-evolving membrane-bound hydrogenase subunit E [Ilumatobacter coccineus]BAN04125.1 Na(+)/H(+) antiporter subunit A [Ilumatobacter coccineus YM16-304]